MALNNKFVLVHKNFEIRGQFFHSAHFHELDEDPSFTGIQHKLERCSKTFDTLKTEFYSPELSGELLS